MDIDSIKIELNKKFKEALPDYYTRRIVFWHDEEGEFKEQLEGFELDNAKVLILTGTNNFYAKKLLTVDDTESNYLVYDPFPIDKPNNWLYDIELYSDKFQADLISTWMDEMHLSESIPQVRQTLREYKKFFNAKKRRDKITAIGETIKTAAQLHQAIMAYLCGTKEMTASAIAKTVFAAGLELEANSCYQELANYGEDKIFWQMMQQMTGYSDETPTLKALAGQIFITACSRTMHTDYLRGLENFISSPHQAFCYDFVSEWKSSNDLHNYKNIACYVEDEAKLVSIFSKVPIEHLLNTDIFPCIDTIIINMLMRDVAQDIIDTALIRNVVEKRRTCAWYSGLNIYYEGLIQLSNMQDFYIAHSAGFHETDPYELWNKYTGEYCLMDTCYRNFHLQYAQGLKQYHGELGDLWDKVKHKAERIYVNWFLEELGANWTKISQASYRDYGRITGIPLQENFYKNHVKPVGNRVFVIISDALRYEVASTLATQLKQEGKSDIKLESMQAIFPSATKFGMAALLPHKELTAKAAPAGIEILADGMSTASTNRDKILKNANPASLAVSYSTIVNSARAERQAMVKGMQVVYIYHDRIDSAGHGEDTDIFRACSEAVEELKNLIRIIVNDFSGVNVLITADHGFLYTYSPLQESDKVGTEDFDGKIIEKARRYIIAEGNANSEHMMPMLIMEGRSEYKAFSPKENIRLKIKGAGGKFVHGGASLQEMVVPVLEYHAVRSSSKSYQQNKERYDIKAVTIKLLSANHKISNMIFGLDFYQPEAVGGTRIAAQYQAYFVDSVGNKISDVQQIIADKTDPDMTTRKYRCNFNLKSLKYSNKEKYYLVIDDENGMEQEKTEFQIDIAFAVEDFGFFS